MRRKLPGTDMPWPSKALAPASTTSKYLTVMQKPWSSEASRCRTLSMTGGVGAAFKNTGVWHKVASTKRRVQWSSFAVPR